MSALQQGGMPQGAQIPLQNFQLPKFPPEAGSLRSLTLASEIEMSDYQSVLQQSYLIPPVPPAIESLTLELFSFGYPAGFLGDLAQRLPNVKSVVFFSQLLGGLEERTSDDVVMFFRRMHGLRDLHLLDVFARPGLFERIAPFVTYDPDEQGGRRGLMFLEINYTTQQGEDDLMSKIPARELPKLIGPGLITLTLNVSEADEDKHENGEQHTGQGVMTFNNTLSPHLVKALTDDMRKPQGLRVLNATLYTLTLEHLRSIMTGQTNLMALMVTLEVDSAEQCRKELVTLLVKFGQKLEQVEIVVSPTLQFFTKLNENSSRALEDALLSEPELETLSRKCTKLKSFKANVLRSKQFQYIAWERKDEKWIRSLRNS